MHITIDISKEATKRLLILGVTFSVGLVAAAVYAALPVPVPTFTDGQVLTAASLTPLSTDITALDTRLAAAETSLTTVSQFQGFSARTATFTKPGAGGWSSIPCTVVDFNTVGPAYNATTGIFTAPKAGYYRFSMSGQTSTPTPAADTRIGGSFLVNGVQVVPAIGGEQLSAVDSPFGTWTLILLLKVGDTVSPTMFSTIDLAFPAGYGLWFQGEFVGG